MALEMALADYFFKGNDEQKEHFAPKFSRISKY